MRLAVSYRQKFTFRPGKFGRNLSSRRANQYHYIASLRIFRNESIFAPNLIENLFKLSLINLNLLNLIIEHSNKRVYNGRFEFISPTKSFSDLFRTLIMSL